ncbi:hypothetical protein HNY73_012908 [Argiope bruennichi]|uniref:Uncharacterized protein n=1 Tax=Argiope bruennichi TaxID=94029 RepID=A0A8T0EY82_ARGBR|nr:hypothetical protein HNY73_012908 [Argiope bruennichi]
MFKSPSPNLRQREKDLGRERNPERRGIHPENRKALLTASDTISRELPRGKSFSIFLRKTECRRGQVGREMNRPIQVKPADSENRGGHRPAYLCASVALNLMHSVKPAKLLLFHRDPSEFGTALLALSHQFTYPDGCSLCAWTGAPLTNLPVALVADVIEVDGP